MGRGTFKIAILTLLFWLGAATPSAAAQRIVDPGATWKIVEGEEALARLSWSEPRLRALEESLRETSNATAIVVAHRGRIVFRYGDIKALSYVASVRKSILAILYGTHVERGTIDLEATLAKLRIDDRQKLLPIEKRATVGDLLRARSGVYHPASNSGDHSAHAPQRGSVRPGSRLLYNNWDFNAAGTIFERCTRRSIYDELERQLAGPLRFEDWDRKRHRRTGNRKKSEHLAYHMHLSTRDMARIGHLMLRRGRWNGKQLVPASWIRKITTPATRRAQMYPKKLRKGRFGYGYMWWVWDGPKAQGDFAGAYTAQGYFGQWITVLPAAELVIAHKTKVTKAKPGEKAKSTSSRDYFAFVRELLRARSE